MAQVSTCLLITTYNRSGLLARSLARFTSWKMTAPDEILVVDDGGSDNCAEICAQAPVPVRYLYTHNPGDSICSHARNVGIKNTDCEHVLTSEPELIFDTDVVAQMLALAGTEVISAGTVHHQDQGGTIETLHGWVAPFAALYRRDWLLDIGGWDEEFESPWGWEDVDLLTRLRHSGHGQTIDQAIEVTHQWHPPRWCDQELNESRFRAKEFPRDIVANQDREWGACLTR